MNNFNLVLKSNKENCLINKICYNFMYYILNCSNIKNDKLQKKNRKEGKKNILNKNNTFLN